MLKIRDGINWIEKDYVPLGGISYPEDQPSRLILSWRVREIRLSGTISNGVENPR